MPRSASFHALESLPLFATDTSLGAALLGPDRVSEWLAITPLLEARGMPKVDELMGGRCVRAIIAWFDHEYGLDRGAAHPSHQMALRILRRGKKSKSAGFEVAPEIWQADLARIESGDQSRLSDQKRAARGLCLRHDSARSALLSPPS